MTVMRKLYSLVNGSQIHNLIVMSITPSRNTDKLWQLNEADKEIKSRG